MSGFCVLGDMCLGLVLAAGLIVSSQRPATGGRSGQQVSIVRRPRQRPERQSLRRPCTEECLRGCYGLSEATMRS